MAEVAGDPSGWTSSVNEGKKVNAMLRRSTGLQDAEVRLEEIWGSRYLFQTKDGFFFWNTVIESGAKVKDLTNYTSIVQQIAKDIRGIKVVPIGPGSGDD